MNKRYLDKLTSIVASILTCIAYFVRRLITELKSRNEIAKRSNVGERFKPHYTNAKSQVYVREREYVITHPDNFVNPPADGDNILKRSESMDEKLSRTKWF